MAVGTSAFRGLTHHRPTRVPRIMPVSLAFAEPSTFIVNASGRVTHDETIEALDQILRHPRLTGHCGVLTDAREVSGAPTTQELRSIARALRPLHASGVPALAIVTSSTFVYGIARMFTVLAEASGLHISVFRGLDEAQHWLSDETR